ncbi:MAG: GNAT family N-acetyltransferase [Anaeromyxobacteraceae bacterium]
MITLRTARLLLRRPAPEDLQPLFAILSDAATMRYWSTPPHADLDTTRRWLERTIAEGHDEFVVVLGERVIGNAGFWRDPEVGFVLDRAFTGQGYAFEAAQAVIARAFAVRGLAVVTADVDPRNAASLRLLARLGFVETGRKAGTFQIGDERCDSVYLALTAERLAGPRAE